MRKPRIWLPTSHAGCARAVGAMWRLRLAVPLEGGSRWFPGAGAFFFTDLGWRCLADRVIEPDDPWGSIIIDKLEISTIGTSEFQVCFINSMESRSRCSVIFRVALSRFYQLSQAWSRIWLAIPGSLARLLVGDPGRGVPYLHFLLQPLMCTGHISTSRAYLHWHSNCVPVIHIIQSCTWDTDY